MEERERNFADECGDHGGTNRHGEPCGRPAGWGTEFDDGKCRNHRGTSRDGSSHEGNTNAATHGAYAESFVEDFLTDDEIERVEQAQELLGTVEGAQDHGRLIAAIAIEQFRRTGDDRFLRRYEAICDKFGIAPADVQKHEHSGGGGGALEVVINREEYDGDE
ncbi:hypothetical protein [Halorarum salinum]|uniref:Uncharacterized protein n=1 Tax=Halorarum salinum TaxID=2743089 RepID=A0A7D5LC66_9EURY|nr:hypothetical protein [Halobaculum salinum]QLG63094.1 hypothetical protein HUG12_15680 [Halobaculum salinum]